MSGLKVMKNNALARKNIMSRQQNHEKKKLPAKALERRVTKFSSSKQGFGGSGVFAACHSKGVGLAFFFAACQSAGVQRGSFVLPFLPAQMHRGVLPGSAYPDVFTWVFGMDGHDALFSLVF